MHPPDNSPRAQGSRVVLAAVGATSFISIGQGRLGVEETTVGAGRGMGASPHKKEGLLTKNQCLGCEGAEARPAGTGRAELVPLSAMGVTPEDCQQDGREGRKGSQRKGHLFPELWQAKERGSGNPTPLSLAGGGMGSGRRRGDSQQLSYDKAEASPSCPPSGPSFPPCYAIQPFAQGGSEEDEVRTGYSQFLGVGLLSSQAAQSSLKQRSLWPLGPHGGIPSPSGNAVEKGILKRHLPAGCDGCQGLRLPAPAQHFLFPERGTAADGTMETVSRLRHSLWSAHATPCLLPRGRGPGPTWTCCWACSCCREAFMLAAKRRSRVAPSWRSCPW